MKASRQLSRQRHAIRRAPLTSAGNSPGTRSYGRTRISQATPHPDGKRWTVRLTRGEKTMALHFDSRPVAEQFAIDYWAGGARHVTEKAAKAAEAARETTSTTTSQTTKTCPGCGKTFPTVNSWQHKMKKWCSPGCARTAHKAAARKRAFQDGPQHRQCRGCGETFQLTTRREQAHKNWCSRKCYMERWREGRHHDQRRDSDGHVGSDEWVKEQLSRLR